MSCIVITLHVMSSPVVSCNKINCVTSFCVLMLWQAMICHVISCHVTCHIMSYYNFMSCLDQTRHFVSFYVTSCHWSCHVILWMLCNVTSCHVMPFMAFMSYHVGFYSTYWQQPGWWWLCRRSQQYPDMTRTHSWSWRFHTLPHISLCRVWSCICQHTGAEHQHNTELW